MEDKEIIQEEHKSKAINYWIWSIPTAVLAYALSFGPVVFLVVKLNKWGYNAEWIYAIYSPLTYILDHYIPVLTDLLTAYVLLWFTWAGGVI